MNSLDISQNLLKSSVFSSEGKLVRTHCFTCGGHGFKDKPCPECGKEPTKVIITNLAPQGSPKVVSATKQLIPQEYLNNTWQQEVLFKDHLELEHDKLFLMYCNQLQKIYSMFEQGIIPHKSAVIVAPSRFSKVTFAYSCMQRAIEFEFKVAPLLDSQEVKRLITLAAERPLIKYGSILYEEYIESDVVFVTITKTNYREEAFSIIMELLDKRSRRGLPTFFISRYNMETMSKRDWNKDSDGLLDYNNTENSLKYPAIIRYWRAKSGMSKGI